MVEFSRVGVDAAVGMVGIGDLALEKILHSSVVALRYRANPIGVGRFRGCGFSNSSGKAHGGESRHEFTAGGGHFPFIVKEAGVESK